MLVIKENSLRDFQTCISTQIYYVSDQLYIQKAG